MKADLYTAQVQSAGDGGLAHRTAAGFVVLTSGDGAEMIELIETNQSQPELIDKVVTFAQDGGPAAFAMLFTAGGDLFLLASGTASASISSASTTLTMSPAVGQVLVHPVSAGINETAATVRLSTGQDTSIQGGAELKAGTMVAGWVDVAIGGGYSPPAEAAPIEPQVTEAQTAANVIVAGASQAPEVAVAAGDSPPAAQEIRFAEDVDAEDVDASAEDPELVGDPAAVGAPDVSEQEAAAAAPSMPEPVEPDAEVPAEHEDAAPVPPPEPEAVEVPVPPAPVVDEAPVVEPVLSPPPPASTGIGPVMVLGVACPQGHHNHPDAVYCSQCGTKMGVHHTTVLLNGPRPPLGVLVVDDGTTYSLSEDLVIGREPSSHADVKAGSATPMILTDDTLSLSRKHAHILLDDWSVFVVDLNSSNGSFISRPGAAEPWTQVPPETPVPLEPGDRLRVGGRIIQVELHHVR